MQLIIPDAISEKLLLLAAEELAPLEDLLTRLVEEEDRRRHVDRPPFEGEKRVKCTRELCFETERRRTAADIDQMNF